jgi:hypothetical protein
MSRPLPQVSSEHPVNSIVVLSRSTLSLDLRAAERVNDGAEERAQVVPAVRFPAYPEAPPGPAARDNLGHTTSQINLPRTSRRAAGAISGALGAALGQFYS